MSDCQRNIHFVHIRIRNSTDYGVDRVDMRSVKAVQYSTLWLSDQARSLYLWASLIACIVHIFAVVFLRPAAAVHGPLSRHGVILLHREGCLAGDEGCGLIGGPFGRIHDSRQASPHSGRSEERGNWHIFPDERRWRWRWSAKHRDARHSRMAPKLHVNVRTSV